MCKIAKFILLYTYSYFFLMNGVCIAELSFLEFFQQAVQAYENGGDQKLKLLIKQNPQVAQQYYYGILANSGQVGNFEELKSYSIENLIIFSIKRLLDLKKMTKISNEASKLSNHSEAINLLKNCLEIAKKYNYNPDIIKFLGLIRDKYSVLNDYENALYYANQHLLLSKEIDKKSEIKSLINIGNIYYKFFKYEKATSFYEQALSIAQNINDKYLEATCLYIIGKEIFFKAGKYKKSLFYLKRASNIFPSLSKRQSVNSENYFKQVEKQQKIKIIDVDCLETIGRSYLMLSEYNKALTFFKLLEKFYFNNFSSIEMLSYSSILENAYILIAHTYYQLGLHNKYIEYVIYCLKRRTSRSNPKGTSKREQRETLLLVANLFSMINRPKRALVIYQYILSYDKENANNILQIEDMIKIAKIYQTIGDYNKTIAYCEKALSIIDDNNTLENSKEALEKIHKYTSLQFELYHQIGESYLNLNQYTDALSFYKKCLKICSIIKSFDKIWYVKSRLGKIYFLLKQYKKSLIFYEEAIDDLKLMRSKISNISIKSITNAEVKSVYMENKIFVYDEMINLLHTLHKKHPDRDFYLKAFNLFEQKQGRMFLEEIGKSGAKHFKKKFASIINEEDSLDNQLKVIDENINKSQQPSSYSLDLFEQVDYNMKECNNLRKENELLWKELEDVQNELKEKYSFHSESIKKDERIQRNTQELILQLYNQKQALSKKIDENEKHLWVCGDSRSNKSIDPATKRILVKKRDKLIKKQKNLRLEIKNKYPDYYAIKYPEPVELQTIQNDILKPRDVILIYNVIEDKTFVWLISKNNIYFDAINIEQYELREKILSHRKEIEKVYKLTCRQESKSKFLSELEKSNKRIVQMGMDLYNILIPNFIEAIIDRSEFLYIVPTDLLYTFPFETLYAKGKFLIEKNAISYLSSVSLLKTLKFSQLNKIERPAYPILAFANPLYKNTCKDQYEKDSLELQFILEKSPKSNNNTNMKKQIKKKKEETNELSNKKWYPEFDFGLNSSKKQDETFTKLEKLHKIYKKIEQRYHQDKEEGLTLSEINNLLENLVTKIDLNSKKIKPPHKNNDYIMPAKKEMCNKEKGNQFLIPSFNSLEETEHEAKAIIQLFNPPESSKPLQLRKNASRSKVLSLSKTQNLDDYKYIIFSCHGVIPDETTSTNQPALVLSQPDPKSDYCKYLTMSDIFNLKMNADLVTLSACNSGIGTYIRGEGLNGLTRAFMYAGTSSVTVTLWRVSSSSEKVLNIGLFKNLKNNIPKAKALQLIKLSMISGKEGVFYKHPYFWAPVILFGL